MKASRISTINFFEDLTSPYAKRRFFWGFAILIFVFLLIFFSVNGFAISSVINAISSLAIEIVAGASIILFFYSLYIFLIGSNIKDADIRVLRPQDINEEVKSLSSDTSTYLLWTRSGSFFRAYTLPTLDELARDKKRNIRIQLLLPNPEEERLVSSYSGILQSLGENQEGNSLLSHVIATCLSCAIASANNRYLDVQIHLSHFLPSFRLDLSDNGVILTHDDKAKSALYFKQGSEFFEMFRSTMLNECNISRKVQWSEGMFHGLDFTKESCNLDTMNAFGIAFSDFATIQSTVETLVTEKPHRYK